MRTMKRARMKTLLSAMTISLLAMLSCSGDQLYFRYHDIPAESWHKDSAAIYEFEVTDTAKTYNVYVKVRNSGDYQHQNLWLFIEKLSPDSTMRKDTINFYLADLRGKWLGSGVGSAFEMHVLYQQNIRFEKKGKYQYKISHGMREDNLKGMSNIGLKISDE